MRTGYSPVLPSGSAGMSFTVYAGSRVLGGADSAASFRNTVSTESSPSIVIGEASPPPDISARKGPLAVAVTAISIAQDTAARAARTVIARIVRTSINHTTGEAMWFHRGVGTAGARRVWSRGGFVFRIEGPLEKAD